MNELEERGQQIADAMGRYRGTEPLIEAVKRMSEQLHTAEQKLSKLENERPVSALDQTSIVSQLRRMADDIVAGKTTVLETYRSVQIIDTTAPDAETRTERPDPHSHLLLLRFSRNLS
jgi:seryl-tRNA synthetase